MARIFLRIVHTNTHAARTRTGTHEGHQLVEAQPEMPIPPMPAAPAPG